MLVHTSCNVTAYNYPFLISKDFRLLADLEKKKPKLTIP